MKIKAFPALLVIAALCFSPSCNSEEDEILEVTQDEGVDVDEGVDTGEEGPSVSEDGSSTVSTQLTLSGIDELGRTVSPSSGDRDGKYVGMFYFLWCGGHDVNDYDVTWLEENAPEALWTKDDPLSRYNIYHYWGKPLYGYYNQKDKWVVTRHAELLTDAGIDFLAMDVSNEVSYDSQMQTLLDVFLSFQKQGFKVPQITFLTHTNSMDMVEHMYETWYTDPTYSSLWFSPNGKPLIISVTSWSSKYDDMMSNFDVKYCQWPQESTYPNGFTWIEWIYPQPLHTESRMMSVSVCQHITAEMSQMDKNWGRSFSHATGVNDNSRLKEGVNYQEQWDTAHNTGDGLDIVFITGWNEWIAGKKYNEEEERVYFIDEFDTDYSRDIELMDGGYADNYFMQTVENVRKFKSTGTPGQASVKKMTIDIDGNLSQWDDAQYVYHDFSGDALARNYAAFISMYGNYTDNSNRNDIVTVKVATDDEYAYFYVETADDITEYTDGTNWMNIMIGWNREAGFEGYEYLINAAPNGDTTSVSKFTGDGFKYSDEGTARLRVSGKVMQVQVSLETLGLSADSPWFAFKVCDNVTVQSDIMDYYVSGDCAPLGRLSYTYGY